VERIVVDHPDRVSRITDLRRPVGEHDQRRADRVGRSASRAVLQLPVGWGARTQTLTLGGSTDGTTFTTEKFSAAYAFDPNTRNTVTLTSPAATQRYCRVTITANNGWPAGRVSEFQIWNS
jgi:hypothetical protein